MTLKKIKEAIKISAKFGIKHAFVRTLEYARASAYTKKINKLYKKTKPNKAVIKNILGSKMLLDMDDYGIHKELFLDGFREPKATEFTKKILKKDDVVLDLGANIGYYVLLEAQICKKVYAIEPDPQNIKNLRENIKLNNYKNIEVYEMAMGEENKTAKMYLSEKCNWHSFYKQSQETKSIEVKMMTVDEFLKDKEKPNFLRMDVEGYEYHIIKGMKKSLKNIQTIFMELHSEIMTEKETKELLDILKNEKFSPSLIVHYDRPGLSKVLPNNHIQKIYQGDKGNYEIFFQK